MFLLTILIPSCDSSTLAFHIMYSAYKLNKLGDNIQPWRAPFPDSEAVCCSMSGSNCCFLTCIQSLQEACKVFWYSHLLKNFPQFAVIHTVKGWSRSRWSRSISGILLLFFFFFQNVFLEFSCFFYDPMDAGAIWSLILLPFLNPACTSGSSWFTYCWSLAWRILRMTLLACEMSAIVQ